jgi:hypothetical protein
MRKRPRKLIELGLWWSLIAPVASVNSASALENEDASLPAYYDHLRFRQQGITVVESGGLPSETRSNIYEVTIDETDTTYRLADIKTVVPFSNGTKILPGFRETGFTAILAAYHFNNVNKSPFLKEEDLNGCNVRLTMELVDSRFSLVETTRTFTEILRRPRSLQTPPTAAVIGAHRSAVSRPLAMMTAVHNIPLISWASNSADLDLKEEFPLFGRTISSAVGSAEVALKHFKFLGAKHVAVLFVTVGELNFQTVYFNRSCHVLVSHLCVFWNRMPTARR